MAEELRERLRTVDESAPSIQGAANAMMKHYDRSTTSIAVNEWRNALFSTTSSTQYIPLLYVANEVLQNSKRNRGNKFLESFSPILLQSLIYMVQQIHQSTPATAVALVEKIRRVIKIWADRRVFSTRFVNEVLTGLEPYRTPQQRQGSTTASIAPPPPPLPPPPQEPEATFSPPVNDNDGHNLDDSQQSNQTTVSHEDILGILEAHEREKYTAHRSHASSDPNNDRNEDDDDEEEDDDDDDDLFADNRHSDDLYDDMMIGDDSEQHPSLSIDVNMTDAVAKLAHAGHTRNKRRRRSSAMSNTSSGKSERRSSTSNTKSTLSNLHFLEIWNQLVENQQKYDMALIMIQQIQSHIASVSDDELSNLVGDELQQAVQQNETDIKRLVQQKRMLHGLANERYVLGLEATRYIPWLETLIKQDTDDIQFSTILEEKIRQFLPICQQLQATRKVMQQEQQRLNEINAEKLRRQKEAEENEKFKRDVLAMQTEAKPGMVWNPTTREYQALNTDESWRD
jgi:CID domain